jgi:hypothetical protein
MADLLLQDPRELEPAALHRQASRIASKGSRGSDRNWYRQPHELEWQWHVFFDGGRDLVSATHHRPSGQWKPGPEIALVNLTTGEGAADFLEALRSEDYFPKPPRALGIFLHVGDEFALSALRDGLLGADSPDSAFDLLHFSLVDDPAEVLMERDASADATSWRLLPLRGAQGTQVRALAVALSRSREALLTNFISQAEALKMPVRVAVQCAALEALASLPIASPHCLDGGCLVLLPYLKFTAAFAINASGNLVSCRSLIHRSAPLPAGLGDIAVGMSLAAELAGPGQPPRVVVAGTKAQIQPLLEDLRVFSTRREALELRAIETEQCSALEHLPGRRLEWLTQDRNPEELRQVAGEAMAQSRSFGELWESLMQRGNFFNSAGIDQIYPSQRDLRLLQLGNLLTALLLACLLSLAGYGFYTYYTASSQPFWKLNAAQTQKLDGQLKTLQKEKKEVEQMRLAFQPRNHGWSTLEMLLRLFPEGSGIRLESVNCGSNTVRPNSKGSGKLGYTRSWQIRGLAMQESLDLLSRLNSSRELGQQFNAMSKIMEEPSFAADAGRQLSVNLVLGKNPKHRESAATDDFQPNAAELYPYSFELQITQSLPDNDPLSLPAGGKS